MSVNALIAAGSRPIGEDVPQIANMLQQRRQQDLVANRMAQQDQYAAEDHAQRVDQYNQEKTDRDALQANGESSRLLQITDPQQFATTLQQMPHVIEGLTKAGVDLKNFDAVRSHIQGVYQATAAHLGQAQPKPQEVSAGASLVQPGANPGDPYTTLFTAPKPVDPLEQAKFDETVRSHKANERISAQKSAVDQVANIEVGDPGLTGDAYLATIPESMRGTVKAWSEGRMQLPNNRVASKDPKTAAMMNALAHYDPNFDFANAGARAAVRKSFVAGPDSDNIKNIGTAIHHLATMKGDYDKLGNTRFAWANSVKNAVLPAFGGEKTQAAVGAVGADALAVSHELASVFRRTGMSEGEIRDWQKQISTSATPATSDSIIGKALELMDGRLYELGQKYNNGMGTTKDPVELLKPEDQKLYRQLKGSDAPAISVPGRGVGASGSWNGPSAAPGGLPSDIAALLKKHGRRP